MSAPSMSFAWWERQDHASFLASNWAHASRVIGTQWAIGATPPNGLLVEVGPGNGHDFTTAFRAHLLSGRLRYQGWEATPRFVQSLRFCHGEASWLHASLYDLPPRYADVIYLRAVLEHQPALLPALTRLLEAATRTVVIDWYRPPATLASCDWCEDVPCHTYARGAVLDAIEAAGFLVATTVPCDGNEVWRVERQP